MNGMISAGIYYFSTVIGTAVTVTAVPKTDIMRFYDRDAETSALRKIESISSQYAQMTLITGRRRIGKTTLIRKAFSAIPFVYFFIGKKVKTSYAGN